MSTLNTSQEMRSPEPMEARSTFYSFSDKSPATQRQKRPLLKDSGYGSTKYIDLPSVGSPGFSTSMTNLRDFKTGGLDVEPHPSERNNLKDRFMSVFESIGPFLPASNFIFIWNAILGLFVLYNALSIPVRFGFRDLWSETGDFHDSHVLFILVDYLGDICYWADIVINFRMAYMDHGIIHTDTTKIARNYLQGRFAVDLLAILPLDFFSFDVGIHALLRIPRIIRLNRVLDYFQVWELHTKHSHAVIFLKLFGGIFLYLHWEGCIYMSISYWYGFGSSEWPPAIDYIDSGFWSQYLYALFWAVKATTGLGGETDEAGNDVERIFTLMTSVMSLLIASYIIGSLTNLISAMNETSEEFRTRMANINIYLKNKKVPEALTYKVRNYYNHLWSRQGGIEDDSILSELPTRLRTEVSLFINGEILMKVPFFKDCNPGFINCVVQLLKPEIYTPGDIIVSEGDVGTEMFFISQGFVEVVVKDKVVSILGEGGFFGEIAILFESKRTATIRSKTYCDLFVLRKADLDKVLKSFPDERVKIKAMGEVRMGKDSLRNHLPIDPLFKDVGDKEFYQNIQQYFQHEVFETSEMIFNIADPSENILFLGNGSIDFLDDNEEVTKSVKVSNVGEGFFFGHLDFVLDIPRSFACKATSRCTVLSLDRNDYEAVLEQFPPSVKKNIEKIARNLTSKPSAVSELKEAGPNSYVENALPSLVRKAKKDKSKKEGKKEDLMDFDPRASPNANGVSPIATREGESEFIAKFRELVNHNKSKIHKEDLAAVCKLMLESMQ